LKKIAIVQSNYIPWKGYFDLINLVDEFILYDDMQYTRRDWRNRNKIYTKDGIKWLTIPVNVKGKYLQSIRSIEIADKNWAAKHWSSITHNYSKASFYKNYSELFEELYLDCNENFLSLINHRFILFINQLLGIKTKIRWSYEFDLVEGQSERLLSICKQSNATVYLSGPAAKDYLNEDLFCQEGVKIEWINYSGYPEYKQMYSPFEHGVSIIDLIFNTGNNAKNYLKSF